MFKGCMVALVTPMDEVGDVDYDKVINLVDFHLQQGTDGFVLVGTTGEGETLNHEEHKHLVQYVVREVAGRVPVIAGTGATATNNAITLTKAAMEMGADACLLLTPGYIKPTQEGLFQHYKAISEAVAIPQIIYNNPGRTACDILPETVARLAEFPNIIGLKESTGQLDRAKKVLALCGDKLDVYSGVDAINREMVLAGGKGAISVTANVAPRLMHEMIHAALAGDQVLAESIDAKLAALHEKLFIESNPIPVKWAMMKMGLISSGIRLPLTSLSEQYCADVLAAMKQAGIE
ncbi:MAG: 4-hydroxy-tetrahydrodipicolinate synthase [Legionellales bacterium]|nr:4-hydroxy-tetrahydrodipicolinate synthase [Legionellales bacterium]